MKDLFLLLIGDVVGHRLRRVGDRVELAEAGELAFESAYRGVGRRRLALDEDRGRVVVILVEDGLVAGDAGHERVEIDIDLADVAGSARRVGVGARRHDAVAARIRGAPPAKWSPSSTENTN